MYPPIFATCFASSAVKALLGTSPMRLFPFGSAPQGVALPYAVWRTVTGIPQHMLAEVPDEDGWLIQVDVYAKTADTARDIAQELRDAIEPVANVTFRGEDQDPQSKDYTYTFDVDWQVIRT